MLLGQGLIATVGGSSRSYMLDKNGKATGSSGTLAVAVKGTNTATAKFTLKLTKSTLRAGAGRQWTVERNRGSRQRLDPRHRKICGNDVRDDDYSDV